MDQEQGAVETIFLAALEKSNAEDRLAYLDKACKNDVDFRSRVEQLLRAQPELDGFLEAPAPELAEIACETALEKSGSQVGPYKLLEEIGEGGFGVVYMAEQEEPVRRRVALKVIKPGMDSRHVIARFDAERQALALMDHPNVAHVLDAGTTSQGRPYFVMDLIKGVPITEYSDQASLSTRERLDLFLEVCDGVRHAHQKGIIHRDLKPSNVLVTLHGSKAVPKIIDFGVAKALHQRLTERTLYTRYSQMIGTPLYMSPEQATLSGLDVDTRSDLFSLGVLLYELLTGTTPLEKKRLGEAASYDEIRRAISETEPPTPSQRLATTEIETLRSIAALRQSEPRKVAELLRGDLDWITMKALEKDRTRRYDSVDALAHDIGRYLADEPVEARPPSKGYRALKFVRRNRTRLALTACAALALAAIIGSIGWQVGERSARLNEAMRLAGAALDEADAAIEKHNWNAAKVAALRAQGLLVNHRGTGEIKARLEDILRDLGMVALLEEIQLELVAESGEQPVGPAAGAIRYERAFADYGIETEPIPVQEMARRIRARRIPLEFVSVLETLAAYLRGDGLEKKAFREYIVSVVQEVDTHPFRRQVRNLWEAGDRRALEEVATTTPLEDLSVFSVRTVARALESLGNVNSASVFLERAQRIYPADFWINNTLSHYFHRLERWDEALRFASCAVAVRPESTAAQIHLGIAFEGLNRVDHAILAFRSAATLYRDLFRKLPNLAEDSASLYSAACSAAVAGTHRDRDLGGLEERSRSALRSEAFEWLKASVEHARGPIDYLFRSSRLAGLREDAELVKLPDDESLRLRAFWTDLRRREVLRLEPQQDRSGRPIDLAVLDEHRRKLLPDLVSFASIDDALERSDRSILDENFAAFREVARRSAGERRVAYLDGRLLQLRGDLEAAVVALEKAVRPGAKDSRPVEHLLACLQSLGRDDDAEALLRRAVAASVEGIEELWIESRQRRGDQLRDILENWPEDAKPPIRIPTVAEADLQRAVQVDLQPHFNADVVVEDVSDPGNDSKKGEVSRLVVLDFGERLQRGVPADRRIGVHRLGSYREKNAIEFSKTSRNPVRVAIPRGDYSDLRVLLAGCFYVSKDRVIPARIEFANGQTRQVSVPCPDWAWRENSGTALPPNITRAWGCMAGIRDGKIRLDRHLVLYEAIIEIDEASEVVAIEFYPTRAFFVSDATRLRIFAITAIKRASPPDD